MVRYLAQSTGESVCFLMIQSADHITGATGVTVTVTISKNGSVFATPGGVVTELSSGWYYIQLKTADTDTLGDLAFHCTGTGCDPTDFKCMVVRPALLDPITYITTLLADHGLNLVNEEVRRIRLEQDRRDGRK